MNTSYRTQGHTDFYPQVVLSVVRRPSYTVAALRGDLDLVTAPALRNGLVALLHPGQKMLVLDLSKLWSCDAAGISALISAWHRALALGVSMRLAAPRSHVARILDDTALEHGLRTYPTLPQALRHPLPPALEPAGI
ncbi:STAS domain-containing protein [Actinomadura roseirufa]|uniref:STAS domain-containing protein n=1 Tax=Actinomadura roseirufa TaxID=2094049 RepID=UPI0013F166F0|nr:STAS domain-containing protein [Actinomadura roseirufa]